MPRILFFILIFFAFNLRAQERQVLTLEDYLEQVKNQNLSYVGYEKSAESFELLKKKSKLVTAVTLFGNVQNSSTEQNQAIQIVRYNQIYNRTSQVGLSQVSSFGLNTVLSYTLNHVTYKGLNTATAVNPQLASSNYQVIPKIEMSLPLWQNRFGAATKAEIDSTYFANEAQKFAAKSLSVQEIILAQKIYWNMVYASNALKIQQNALQSAKRIFDYVSKREKMNLGEKADVLQSKALYESRKLALKQAENDYKIAARDFNKKRHIDSSEVTEELSGFDFASLKQFIVPNVKSDDRFDIKAEAANMKAAVADAKITEESNKPSLNLYGSYATNQIAGGINSTVNNTFLPLGRAKTIGINFSTPINFFTTSDIRQGAVKSAAAARSTYQQKVFEQESDWQNLVQNLKIYKESLELAKAAEEAQKAKLENERFRLKQGRTSTYQVLLFEQDYSNSQLVTIQTANLMLALIADQKLYGN